LIYITDNSQASARFYRKPTQTIKYKKMYMRKLTFLFAAIVMMAGFTGKAMAQDTENTAAGAVIIIPITITESSPLHFGVMSVLSGTSGTCVLSTLGVRTQTGGVNLSAQAPAATTAAYDVAGQVSTTYAITLPASSVVTNGTPAEDMTIDAWFAQTASSGVDGLTGTLDGSGDDTFTVGGTLNVAAAQPAGTYAGTFDVTVAYN
jgi:hypothetical protein